MNGMTVQATIFSGNTDLSDPQTVYGLTSR